MRLMNHDCNRRSSYGVGIYSLPCSRRSSYAHSPSSLGGGGADLAVAAANYCQCSLGCSSSRRSSHVSTSEENESPGESGGAASISKAYNRVMSSNHRAVTKPKGYVNK